MIRRGDDETGELNVFIIGAMFTVSHGKNFSLLIVFNRSPVP